MTGSLAKSRLELAIRQIVFEQIFVILHQILHRISCDTVTEKDSVHYYFYCKIYNEYGRKIFIGAEGNFQYVFWSILCRLGTYINNTLLFWRTGLLGVAQYLLCIGTQSRVVVYGYQHRGVHHTGGQTSLYPQYWEAQSLSIKGNKLRKYKICKKIKFVKTEPNKLWPEGP